MNTKLYVDWAGISFLVDAEIAEDEPAYVEEINSVEVRAQNGDYMLVDVDRKEFMEIMQDVLDDAAQEYIQERAIAYAEARMDARREEGL